MLRVLEEQVQMCQFIKGNYANYKYMSIHWNYKSASQCIICINLLEICSRLADSYSYNVKKCKNFHENTRFGILCGVLIWTFQMMYCMIPFKANSSMECVWNIKMAAITLSSWFQVHLNLIINMKLRLILGAFYNWSTGCKDLYTWERPKWFSTTNQLII